MDMVNGNKHLWPLAIIFCESVSKSHTGGVKYKTCSL